MQNIQAEFHILVDSREPSVTQANLLFGQSGYEMLGRVEHIRAESISERFELMLDRSSRDDRFLISVSYISPEQLEKMSSCLYRGNLEPERITLSSFACFSHISAWCRKHGVKFIDNDLKKRELNEEIQAGQDRLLEIFMGRTRSATNSDISLKRIWVQYRLMLAIISRTESLSDVVRQLIQNMNLPENSLEDELVRAVRYFKLGEPDMAGGSYSCEARDDGNLIDRIRQRINIIAATDYNVLLSGESGSGKEAIAWAIHELSPRQNKPFLAINCAGLPDELLESEMFGYKKGSHNRADKEHPGFLGSLNGGSLFLDELPEMSPRIQAKLLRFIESGEYRPIGGIKNRFANVRIIAAGQPALIQEHSRIRQDLLSRVNQLDIQVPPLRELEKQSAGTIKKIIFILLERYTWVTVFRAGAKHVLTPYDIKELQNTFQKKEIAEQLSRRPWDESNVRELNNFLRRWVVFGEEELQQLDKNHHSNKSAVQSYCGPQLYDKSLEKFLRHASTRQELQELLSEKPLRTIRNAYVRHVFAMYAKIIEQENATEGAQKKPSQKELAALMGITENTLSRYKN